MKRRLKEFQFEEKMDMTPLIDVVFLLIMFFILTTQITMNQEDVQLPFALEGVTEEKEEEEITRILNVRLKKDLLEERIGEIVYQKRVLDYDALVKLLQQEVDYDKAPRPYGRGREPEVLGKNTFSQLKIIVRADKRVKAEYLRSIFMACQEVSPKIYKLEISTEQPREQ